MDPARTTGQVRGRDAEVDAIEKELARLQDGTGSAIVVEGPAGIGKSRLLDEARSIARGYGATVAFASADPTEQSVELSSLLQALFGGSPSALDRGSLPELRADPAQRFWAIRDLQAALERAALLAPLAICIDDLHWADTGTAAALRVLPAEVAGLPIAWLFGVRSPLEPGPVKQVLDQLQRTGSRTLTVSALDGEAVARVTTDLLGAEPDQGVLKLVDEAGGSPYLLVEMLRGLTEEDQILVEGARARLVTTRLPMRVRSGMRDRLARLSAPAREAVTVAASLGRSFSFTELAETLGRAPSDLLASLHELLNADLLVEREDRLSFWHDITRQAVRSAIPVSARRALDRQAAGVLLRGGALPIEVAAQVEESAEPGDELAITTLLQASRALAISDPAAAARFGRRALELAPPDHASRGEIVATTAIALHVNGESEDAIAFADAALREVLPAEQEAEARLGIAGMFAISPDVRVAAGRAALELPEISLSLRARHLGSLVHNLFTAGRIKEALETRDAARPVVAAAADRRATFTLLEGESGVEYALGDFGQAYELITAARREGLRADDDQRLRLVRMWHGEVLSVLDRYEEAFPIAIEGLADGRRNRQAWAYQMFDIWRARMSVQVGYLSDAAATLEGRFRYEDGSRIVAALEAAGIVALGRAALGMGDLRQVRRLRSVAQVMVAHESSVVHGHAAWLLAVFAMADNNPAEAATYVRSSRAADNAWILPRIPMDAYDEVDMARIAIAAGDNEMRDQARDSSARRAALNPGAATIQAAAAHIRGLITSDPDELEAAVTLLRDGPRRLATASALEDLGTVHSFAQRDRAVDLLTEALVLYTTSGAARDARRVRGHLRTLGVRRRLAATEAPSNGWGALTNSERAVAEMVASGMTNRETADRLYVSPHTVNSHLRHVFTKLRINSRVELARVARDEGNPA